MLLGLFLSLFSTSPLEKGGGKTQRKEDKENKHILSLLTSPSLYIVDV